MALDSEACYMGFELRLQTEADRATIAQVFEFLAEDSDIVYLPPNSPEDEYRNL